MLKIFIGNDDGIHSVGIDKLFHYAKEWGKVDIITPESQQSAKAKAMTFHKPIRVYDAQTVSGYTAKSYNTSPADSFIIYRHFFGSPDVVLSGINSGENTSIHSILTSGTCAVAMEAGLQNIPAFAFSIDTPEMYFHTNQIPGDLDLAGKLSVQIAKLFLEKASKKFWEKVSFVNVNFPDNLNEKSEIVVCELETYKYDNYLREREDPKGDAYYWLWGDKRLDLDPEKDTSLIHNSKKITITPVSFFTSDILISESKSIITEII